MPACCFLPHLLPIPKNNPAAAVGVSCRGEAVAFGARVRQASRHLSKPASRPEAEENHQRDAGRLSR